MIKVILTFLFTIQTLCSFQCVEYLTQLSNDYVRNKTKFTAEIAPYVLLSGKNIDDLGYPEYCQRNPENRYSVAETTVLVPSGSTYNVYLGFCFTNKCSAEQLNTHAKFLVDFILEDYDVQGDVLFVQPNLELQFNLLTLITCIMLSTFVIIGMGAPIMRWIQLCRHGEEQYVIKSTYIDLENPNQPYTEDEQQITTQSTLLEKLSLKYKWRSLFNHQKTDKIPAFSYFRFIAAIWLMYGYTFYLTNIAAFNYLSFNEQIYPTFYAKLATFSYYLPDVFFFISGFLFARKLIPDQEQDQEKSSGDIVMAIARRFARLYPLYLAVWIIYWLVSPGLHAGPVWFVYEEAAGVCDGSWWRVLLMIDNWFGEGCYPGLWFVQVEFQLTFIAGSFFAIHYLHKLASYIYLGALLIASWVLMFVLSTPLLTSLDVTINPDTQIFFRSLYSHSGFYLFGLLLALVLSNSYARQSLTEIIGSAVTGGMFVVAFGIVVLVLFRPLTWQDAEGVELTLCRTGILVAALLLFLPSILKPESHSTNLHKFAYCLYPVILVIPMIAESSFWAAGSFPYVSSFHLVNNVVPTLLITFPLGIFLAILFDFRFFTSLK